MTSQPTDYTVLVVEDDPNHQLLIRRALGGERSGFSVVQVARDSHEAERFIRQMPFDCILVDNRIPGRRGLDLIDTLRDEGVDAPFVLMTSAGTEDLAVQAYRRRVADYVIKQVGFWKDLPQILTRVIREDQVRRRELELRARLERTNARLDELNTDVQLQNEQLRIAQRELEARHAALDHLRARLRTDLPGALDHLQALAALPLPPDARAHLTAALAPLTNLAALTEPAPPAPDEDTAQAS